MRIFNACIVSFALALAHAGPAIAGAGADGRVQISQANPAEGLHEGLGTVIHVDREKGQIVINHAPIEGVMEGMTMGFGIADPALLEGVLPDDGVRFIVRVEDMTIVELTIDPAGKLAAGGGMKMGEGESMEHQHGGMGAHARADAQAPVGVGRDHVHHPGSWVPSYKYMHMNMEGTRDGGDTLDTEVIATTIPNRFFGLTGQPATLRIVPVSMTMDMHMFGLMYTPFDWLSLMGMTMYVEKNMSHVTFRGGAGTARRGEFSTKAEGLGDTELNTTTRVFKDGRNSILVNMGVSLPTGSITNTGQILLPTGARPIVRLPYSMQLGSGSFDLLPGLTYTGGAGDVAWGAQYKGTYRTHENGQGYTLGHIHRMTGWASYLFIPEVSASLRLNGEIDTGINGIDQNIVGAVQTADPDNYGGRKFELGFGLNFMGSEGGLAGQRLGLELVVPVHRDLNGPQLETDWTISARIALTF